MPGSLPPGHDFPVLIVGGGAAGITVAAMLRRMTKARIGIVEPSETHAYQPGWTLVGAGVFRLGKTLRREAALIPHGVDWIRGAVAAFSPAENAVALTDGRRITYDYLVVCPGLKLDWDAVDGLAEAIGHGGVCSNYRGDYAAYTWECLENFGGGKMIFTQPATPIKCPGAPQKIAYLAADHLRRSGRRGAAEITFCTGLATLFGVAPFVPALEAAMRRHNVAVRYKTDLRAIDAKAKKAIFAATTESGAMSELALGYDMIHVTPPQCAVDCMKGSPIADAAGFVAVDPHTMRHRNYENIFALGDAANAPNSKTAAAVRMQAPVVVQNLLAAMKREVPRAAYDGYASCPLTTDYGHVVLAEFTYDGKVTPSFPFDPRVPRRSAWLLKKDVLPLLYWRIMLKGINLDFGHRERSLEQADRVPIGR